VTRIRRWLGIAWEAVPDFIGDLVEAILGGLDDW
jgi:hypothetical protein